MLVVIGHVVLEMGRTGALGTNTLLAYLTDSLMSIRMPLFTVISGYVYALRPVKSGLEAKFMAGKARRLVLPLVSVGLITMVYADYRRDGVLFSDLGTQAFEIFVLNSSHLWFIKALLWILLLTTVLDAAKAIDRVVPWSIVLGLAVLGSFAVAVDLRHLVKFMAVGNALYILPFFFLGLGIRRFGDAITPKPLLLVAPVLLLGGLIFQQWEMRWADGVLPAAWADRAWEPWLYASKAAVIAVGLSATTLLFVFRRPLPGITFLGNHAYAIFLFHSICLYIGYLVTSRVAKVSDPYAVFAVMTVVGLLAPIGCTLIIQRMRWSRWFFLGLR